MPQAVNGNSGSVVAPGDCRDRALAVAADGGRVDSAAADRQFRLTESMALTRNFKETVNARAERDAA